MLLKREVYVGTYPWRPWRNAMAAWPLRTKGWPVWAVCLEASLP